MVDFENTFIDANHSQAGSDAAYAAQVQNFSIETGIPFVGQHSFSANETGHIVDWSSMTKLKKENFSIAIQSIPKSLSYLIARNRMHHDYSYVLMKP